jgi:predicted nucleic-acid-binding protein
VRIADANFVLRYLLKDVADQFETARGVLEKQRVFIPFEVVAEVVYVLQSVYEVPNPEIADSLWSLLNYPNISTSDREVAMYAIQSVARSELDIVDALLLGQAVLRDHEILTFDRKLARTIGRTSVA